MAEKLVNTNKFKFHRRIYPQELTLPEQVNNNKISLIISTGQNQTVTETFSFKNNRSEKNDWSLALNQFVESYRANCVYGTPLSTLIEREQIPEGIPFVMVLCINYIKG